jgi:uncharacterized membrane protein
MPLHPIVIHFPLAFLTIGFAAEVIAVATRRDAFSTGGWWLQCCGTAGIALAVLSGLYAKSAAVIPAAAATSIDLHQQLAFLSSCIYAGLLFWRTAHRGRIPEPRLLFLALYAAASLLLWFTGWFGGELVFTYGIGIRTPLP